MTQAFEEPSAVEQVLDGISHSRKIQADPSIVWFVVQLIQHLEAGHVCLGTRFEIEHNCRYRDLTGTTLTIYGKQHKTTRSKSVSGSPMRSTHAGRASVLD